MFVREFTKIAYDDNVEIGECIVENAKKCNKNVVAECSYAKKVIEKL